MTTFWLTLLRSISSKKFGLRLTPPIPGSIQAADSVIMTVSEGLCPNTDDDSSQEDPIGQIDDGIRR